MFEPPAKTGSEHFASQDCSLLSMSYCLDKFKRETAYFRLPCVRPRALAIYWKNVLAIVPIEGLCTSTLPSRFPYYLCSPEPFFLFIDHCRFKRKKKFKEQEISRLFSFTGNHCIMHTVLSCSQIRTRKSLCHFFWNKYIVGVYVQQMIVKQCVRTDC